MATLNGLNYAKKVAVPGVKIAANEQYGRVRVLYDEYTLTGDLSANDVINMMTIPAGAKVLNCLMETTDLDASGGTLDLGWVISSDAVEAADDDGFIAAADVTSAGRFQPAAARPGNFKTFASPVQVQVKVNGDTDATSGTIKVAIYISVD